MGNGAVSFCESLETVKLPKGIKSISEEAFFADEKLKSIVIPDGVESIGKMAFAMCFSLSNITFPKSVNSIEKGAFDPTKWLNDQIAADQFVIVNGILLYGPVKKTEVEIPRTVTSMQTNLFYRSAAEIITVPSTVKEIPNYCFTECKSLQAIVIPGNVTSIGEGVLRDCDNVTIYGVKGSCAEQYAKENNIPFDVIANLGQKNKRGDITGDGKIDLNDTTALKKHIINIRKLTGNALEAADANGDGKVDMLDVTAIKRHILGIKKLW